MPAETIIQRFQERVRAHPDKVALRYKADGRWQSITWGSYGTVVRRAAKGLMSLGLAHGDKMSLLSFNRPQWHFADIACMSIGACTAPIYVTNSPEQVAYIVGHSESKIACVENPGQLAKILKTRSELPNLSKVIVFEGYEGDADADFVMSWDGLLAAGDALADGDYEDAVAQHKPEHVATFVYTSGTTGPPKAVMLTHSNLWWTAQHSEKVIPLGEVRNARALSYLPLSHIAERMISHLLQVYYGSETWFVESIEKLRDNLVECRPTYFFGVPRVWEKFYAGIQEKLAAADPNNVKTKLAKRGLEAGKRMAEAEQEAVRRGGKLADARMSPLLKVEHALLDKLVLHKVRDAIGLDRCRIALSAAAPLSAEMIWFFHSIGIKIIEIYGQSEDTGPTTINPPEAIKIGSVGKAMPGVEVKIAEDGEILVRGGNVTSGYYKDEKATAELLDSDGWMHSGDVGEFDAHGYLRITDRKKDLIITAGGKNVAPQEIETRLKVFPLISQAVVIGDKRPFLTALITIDEEKAIPWAAERGIEGSLADIVHSDKLLGEMQDALNKVNDSLARVEGVKKFRVLDRDFLQEENEITPTLKVKRKQIAQIYGGVIEDMYRKDAPAVAAAEAPVRR